MKKKQEQPWFGPRSEEVASDEAAEEAARSEVDIHAKQPFRILVISRTMRLR